MSDHYRNEDPFGRTPDQAYDARARADEPMEDEEKILAGRIDVNMPALLTRDVLGG